MNPLIDVILSQYEREGHRIDCVTPMLDLAESDPAVLEDLLMESMARDCAPATFLDRALGLLADERLIAVVAAAWERLRCGSANRQVREIVGHALYQACDVLTDDWEALLAATEHHGPAAGFPWRTLPTHVAERWAGALGEANGREDVGRALALLRSRNAAVRDRTLAYLRRATGHAADSWAHEAGIDPLTGAPLHSDYPMHVQFRGAQRKAQLADQAPWRRRLWRLHDTWGSGERSGQTHMGGNLETLCGFCHAPLQRLLELDAQLVGAADNKRLSFGLCLDCCGWNGLGPLFYRHDSWGHPHAHPAQWSEVPAEDVDNSGALMEAEPALVNLGGNRWREQDFGMSNSDENLSRVGGAPSWVQSAQYPQCPDCRATMPFVMQLDSVLPVNDGGILLWGSGGMLYTYWCDHCAVSAHLWQCT